MLGSRASDAYGRCYDKGVESKTAEAGEVWRWEVELKRKRSLSAALELVGREDALTYARDLVYGFFWRAGIRPCFERRHKTYQGL